MKKYLILLQLLLPTLLFAHDGVNDETAKTSSAKPMAYFSVQATSDVYELLLKYSTLPVGKEAKLKLFVSDFNTNTPIDTSATVQISVSDNPSIKLNVNKIENGTFEVKGVFPEKKTYNFTVNINSTLGPDLLLLSNITIGKLLVKEELPIETKPHWYSSNWFFGLVGVLFGLVIMFFVMKKTNRKVVITTIIVLCLLPSAQYNTAAAHGGEDHEEGNKGSGVMSSTFLVEKESQFLFGVVTQNIGVGNFNQSSIALGTVVASPKGSAVIQSPQTGKIIALKVNPGQEVSAGQVLAVVEQTIDAVTQSTILAQNSDWKAKRNEVEAQYTAAKIQYNRLLTIQDIVAKKDITEAKARFDQAEKNKELYQNIPLQKVQGAKYINLTSPISGIVGNYKYAVGSFINSGETLLEVTNLNKVFVDAQLFANDVAQLKNVEKITTTSNQLNDTLSYRLKVVSTAQSVNNGNQSQKVIFEIINPKANFKIGENINVNIFSKKVSASILVPTNAIAEINGKPAVFVKDKAEQYSIIFISKGGGNEKFTSVFKGIEVGERIVTGAVYQMKSIYLNQ